MKPILVTYLENDVKSDRWRLERSVTYQTRAGKVTVPRGFITDFASVPMLLWVSSRLLAVVIGLAYSTTGGMIIACFGKNMAMIWPALWRMKNCCFC
ncbi:DUF1353 domain-containing protein [Spirosoma sp. HMF3257]|uniref:Uncharacterized protein n=1 Tax=Spirosoma telluris TaxID=2183553 RepID=A0A327NDE6_9BACT|nr:DUF1353 domain-containing protein [Spirosoma telluris]RAI73301.1 hypothetical protein HMF3257_00595 [Spirosoma telluris]